MIAYFLTHEGDHDSESTVQRAREQMESKENAYVLEVEQISWLNIYKITKYMFTSAILPKDLRKVVIIRTKTLFSS